MKKLRRKPMSSVISEGNHRNFRALNEIHIRQLTDEDGCSSLEISYICPEGSAKRLRRRLDESVEERLGEGCYGASHQKKSRAGQKYLMMGIRWEL